MVMFAMVTGISMGAMAFASATSPISFGEPQDASGRTGAAPKQDRLRMKPKADACDGRVRQFDGSDCLVMIANADPVGSVSKVL